MAMAEPVAEAGHEAASGGLPQFDPTWFASQLFWLAIAFGVMYLVFSRRTLPDLSSIIENRKNHIQADLDQAEDLTSQAEGVQDAYESGLQGARDRATTMVNDVHASMQARKNEQTETFRVKSEQDVKATEARLAAATDKAMNDISDIVAEVAAQAVEKIIGVSTDAKQAKSVVNRLSDVKAKAA